VRVGSVVSGYQIREATDGILVTLYEKDCGVPSRSSFETNGLVKAAGGVASTQATFEHREIDPQIATVRDASKLN
jgi:hypothetical protein